MIVKIYFPDDKDYWIRYLPNITEQCSNNQLIPSLLTFNDQVAQKDNPQKELIAATIGSNNQQESEIETVVGLTTDLILSKSINELSLAEEVVAKKVKELSMDDIKDTIQLVSDEVNELKSEIECFEQEMKILEIKRIQILEQKKMEHESLENNVKQLKIKSRSFKLLPSKDENIEKLEEMIQEGTQKLTNLANQWDKHRTELIQEYRNLRQISTSKQVRGVTLVPRVCFSLILCLKP